MRKILQRVLMHNWVGRQQLSSTRRLLFGRYLLATNTVSAGVLMTMGDLMAQEIEYQRGFTRHRYDWVRLGRMFVVGAVQGPLHHYFYRWLDRIMPNVSLRTTIYKMLMDQVVMAPLCLVGFFYPAGWMEGKTTAECTTEIRSKFLTIYAVDWCVWPATQFINFHYLKPQYRVVYVNVITMLYNVFLSYMKHMDCLPLKEEGIQLALVDQKQNPNN